MTGSPAQGHPFLTPDRASLFPLPSDSSPSSSSTPASGCSSPNDSEHGPNPALGSEVRPCGELGSPGGSSESQPFSSKWPGLA